MVLPFLSLCLLRNLTESQCTDPQLCNHEVKYIALKSLTIAIGDPPNVIITAHHEIVLNGIDFSTFTVHMFVGIIFVYIASFIHFRFLLADPNIFMKDTDSEFDELETEIRIWTLSYQSITPVTKGEKIVKTLLKEKVSQLTSLLSQTISDSKIEHITSLKTKSLDLVESYKITKITLLIKCSAVFLITLILFFLNPFVDEIQLTIGWISVLSAIILLAVSSNNFVDAFSDQYNGDTNDSDQSNSSHFNAVGFEAVMHKIEWSTLLFFSGKI